MDGISRRRLIRAGALGALAAMNPFGLRIGMAGVLPGGVTTLDRTILLGPPGPGGYRKLVAGPGEAHVTRAELASASTHVDWPLIAFAQMSDLHIIDDQSPLRVEFLDRYGDPGPPYFQAYDDFDAAYRAHECMSTQLTDAMCRAIAKAGRGPVTSLPLRFTLVTGDMVDNAQYNETRWYIDLLDGSTVVPNSGGAGDQSVTGAALGVDKRYWHPAHQYQGPDQYQAAGFPMMAGLPERARNSFTAYGLRMPWYAAYGNHDRNVQGNADPGAFLLGKALNHIATGSTKPINTKESLPPDGDADFDDWLDLVRTVVTREVQPDPARRLLSRADFMGEHFKTSGLPVGHGFANVANDADYVIPSGRDDLFQFICLDTTESNSSKGSIDDEQFEWLRAQLRACSSRYEHYNVGSGQFTRFDQPGVRDKLVVIFCHHTLDTMNDDRDAGGDLRRLLLGFPNVIMMVNGHTHKNKITPHPRPSGSHFPGGGFWEINTASHIDWPIQSRLIEVAAGDGVMAIYTTMVDIDAPLEFGGDKSSPTGLASLARELAANDIQRTADPGGITKSAGQPADRNAKLLLPMPFKLSPRPARITMARNSDGRMDVFALNNDGLVFLRRQTAAGGQFPGWDQMDGVVKTLAAEANADGRLQLFAINAESQIYHRWQNTPGGTWTKWTFLDGTLTSIATTRDSAGRIEIFGANAASQVYHRRQDTPGGAFGSWTQLTDMMAQVTVETNADGSTVLFGLNSWGRVFQRIRANQATAWSGWVPLTNRAPRLLSISAVKRPDNRLSVIGTDAAGRLWRSTQTAPNAISWSELAEPQLGGFDPGFLSTVSAEVNLNGSVELHAIGQTGKVARTLLTDGPSAWEAAPDLIPVQRTVPSVIGKNLVNARQALESQYLYVGTIGDVPVKEKLDAGKVRIQFPNAGTAVAVGSAVNLTFGRWDGSHH